LAVDRLKGDIIHGPEITSHGFVSEEIKAHILEDAQCILLEVMEDCLSHQASPDWALVRNEIQRKLKGFFNRVLERRPVILPIIIEL
jgi:ribonuclease J